MKKFTWDAEDYANHSRSQQQWGRELIQKLHLNGNEHLLDIGCGDGKITAEIAKTVVQGSVIGIDSSKEMISLALEKYAGSDYSNLHFRLLNAENLDYRDKFDVVFSNAVLHWIEDHASLLRKIYNSLRPHGRALLQMGGKGNASEIINVLSDMMKTETWQKYFRHFNTPYHFYSPDDYQTWINQTGFSKSRIELIPKEMIHENRSDIEGWIRTTWLPYLKQIPESLHNKFINDLVENYLILHPKTENGLIKVKMARLEVDLVK